MSSDPDDEALSWDGDVDPTHTDQPTTAPGAAAREHDSIEPGEDTHTDVRAASDVDAPSGDQRGDADSADGDADGNPAVADTDAVDDDEPTDAQVVSDGDPVESDTPVVEAAAEPRPEATTGITSDAPDSTVAASAPQPMGNAMLVGLGVMGGVYVLWMIGWLIGGFRLQGQADYLITDGMFQASFWLSVLAPPLWFVSVLLLTRRARGWQRVLWLVVGIVLLVPWPFVLVGTVGT